MLSISLRILFVHWLAFLDALQQFFWNYTPQPLLSTVFPKLIEGSSKFPPTAHAPRIGNPSDYSGSVDLATTCLVPTLHQTSLTMNLSCSVDRPDYDLDHTSLVESSHYYVFPDIPVWQPPVPHEGMAPTSPSARTEDDHGQTNVAPYGARGLSFCPVLVGLVYIRSLLHLYMLLMIPSLFNHWFEDVLVYESLNPTELLDGAWLLHTSLWVAPWHLLRYGVRKAVPCLYRRFRRLGHKSAHPPVPRIVLIRVDGEAVPVDFVEDHQFVVCSPPESVNLKMRNSLDIIFDGGEPEVVMQSIVSDGDIATECAALLMQPVSHQGGFAEVKDGMAFGSLISEFADDSQLFVNDNPDGEISPILGETTNEPVEKGALILPIPGPDTLVTTSSDFNIDERTDEVEQTAFMEIVVDDTRQDGMDSLGERGDADQDGAFSPWNFSDDDSADESETSSETVSATASSVGSQDTPTPVKNVRFSISDDAGAADRAQVSSGGSLTDEWSFGCERGDDDVTPVQIPDVPFDLPMDEPDVTSPGKATKPILPVVLGEERVEENNMRAETLSPSVIGKPIVKLPSTVAIREDMRFVEMDRILPAAPIEDIATRSPLQIFSPIAPVVVINMNCIIEIEEQRLIPPGSEELDGLPHTEHAFDWVEALEDKAVVCDTLDVVSPREDGSCLPGSPVEGSNSVCSPIVDGERSLGDFRTLDVTSSSSAALSEIGMPVLSTALVVTNTNPGAATAIPGTNELGAEILYETPRYYSDWKAPAGSLPNGFQGPEVSVSDTTGTGMRLPALSESPKRPAVEDQVNQEPDSTTITLTGRLVGLPDACKEIRPLSAVFGEKKTSELDHGKGREADAIPCDHRKIMSKTPPERTLSGSLHAPSGSLLIPRRNSDVDRTSVLYETPPFMVHSVSLARPDEGKRDTNVITEKTPRRGQDLSASIHAPQRVSKPEAQPSVSQSRDENSRGHRRSVTSPGVVSEKKPVTKPCSPNWTAMPEVVDAFRMFKQAPSGNTIRRVSSIAECTKRGPLLGVVGQKGIATNSLNNTSAIASVQSRWIHGSGLLLVRDLVPTDPADFNLRTCTNLRTSGIHSTRVIPVQRVLYPGLLDIPPYALQHGITPCPVAGPAGNQRQQSVLVPNGAETVVTLGSQCWMAYRG